MQASASKPPKGYASLMEDDDEVCLSDTLSLQALHICHTVYKRGYVRDFMTGVTDGRRTPWNRIFECIWSLMFAKAVGKLAKVDRALTDPAPDTGMGQERINARIRSMSTIAIAIYDKGYSRFDSLRVPVEILIAKDKKAWCELLDAFLNIIIHSKGDPAADFILNGIDMVSPDKHERRGAGISMKPIDMTIPASAHVSSSTSPVEKQKSQRGVASTPGMVVGAMDGTSRAVVPSYADITKASPAPVRNRMDQVGTPFATPSKQGGGASMAPGSASAGDGGLFSKLKSLPGFMGSIASSFESNVSLSKEDYNVLVQEKSRMDFRVRQCEGDVRDLRESKLLAEKEVLKLQSERALLIRQLAEYSETAELFQKAQAELTEVNSRYQDCQTQLNVAIANVNEFKQSMEANSMEYRDKEKRLSGAIERLTAECQAAKEQVESKERQLIENSTAYEDKLDAEVTKSDALVIELKEMEAAASARVSALTATIDSHLGEIDTLRQTIVECQAREAALKAEYANLAAVNEGNLASHAAAVVEYEEVARSSAAREVTVTKQLTTASAALSTFKRQMRTIGGETREALSTSAAEFAQHSKVLIAKVDAAQRSAKEANERYVKEQAERRKLHNQLQEAKGNIRVFCRIRPMSSKEEELGETSVVKSNTPFEVNIIESASERAGGRLVESKSFEFDRVFGADSTQHDVFDEVQPMVISALDGFHACIFAYGQTGSGKTFTMEGPASNRGVYFRALANMFEQVASRRTEYAYTMKVSMVEIYNETVNDLLSLTPARDDEDASGLEVKTGPNGNFLPDATIMEVRSVDEVEELMARGATNRTVGRTNANEHSSRSHSLLMIDIYGTNLVSDVKTYGRLVLVDLAGSERLSKSGAEGQRLKEAQNINKSLSALGDVISALSNKAGHIPFRNSKLTWLLADSLGKDNKTLMIVQVSPVISSRQESSCSLTFASRVRKVELGKAVKHADSGEMIKVKAELKRIQDISRSASVDVDRLREAAVTAQEGEGAARARAAELERQVAELGKEVAGVSEANKRIEALQAAVRAEKEAAKADRDLATARADEIDRLQKALKEASKSAKSAVTAAAEVSTTKVDTILKKTVEDERAKAKLESRKAVADAEAAAKLALDKQAEAMKRQQKEALVAADARAKADLSAALATARLQWERDNKRAAIRKDRISLAASKRTLIRLSTATAGLTSSECDAGGETDRSCHRDGEGDADVDVVGEDADVARLAADESSGGALGDVSAAGAGAVDMHASGVLASSRVSMSAVAGEASFMSLDSALRCSGVTLHSVGASVGVAGGDMSHIWEEGVECGGLEDFATPGKLATSPAPEDASFAIMSADLSCDLLASPIAHSLAGAFASPVASSSAAGASGGHGSVGGRQATPFKSAASVGAGAGVEEREPEGEEEDETTVDSLASDDEHEGSDVEAGSTRNKLNHAAPTPMVKKHSSIVASTVKASARTATVVTPGGMEEAARDENRKKLAERRMKRDMGFASPPTHGILKRKVTQQQSSWLGVEGGDKELRKATRLMSPTTASVLHPGVSTPMAHARAEGEVAAAADGMGAELEPDVATLESVVAAAPEAVSAPARTRATAAVPVPAASGGRPPTKPTAAGGVSRTTNNTLLTRPSSRGTMSTAASGSESEGAASAISRASARSTKSAPVATKRSTATTASVSKVDAPVIPAPAAARCSDPLKDCAATDASGGSDAESDVAPAVLRPASSASNVMAALAAGIAAGKTTRGAHGGAKASKFVAVALGGASRVVRSGKIETSVVKTAVRVSVYDAASSVSFDKRAAASKKAAAK